MISILCASAAMLQPEAVNLETALYPVLPYMFAYPEEVESAVRRWADYDSTKQAFNSPAADGSVFGNLGALLLMVFDATGPPRMLVTRKNYWGGSAQLDGTPVEDLTVHALGMVETLHPDLDWKCYAETPTEGTTVFCQPSHAETRLSSAFTVQLEVEPESGLVKHYMSAAMPSAFQGSDQRVNLPALRELALQEYLASEPMPLARDLVLQIRWSIPTASREGSSLRSRHLSSLARRRVAIPVAVGQVAAENLLDGVFDVQVDASDGRVLTKRISRAMNQGPPELPTSDRLPQSGSLIQQRPGPSSQVELEWSGLAEGGAPNETVRALIEDGGRLWLARVGDGFIFVETSEGWYVSDLSPAVPETP